MMKSNLLLTLLAVAIAANLGMVVKSCRQQQQFDATLSAMQDTTSIWKDAAGRWQAQAQVVQVSPAQMRQLFRDETLQLKKDLGLHPKNVTGFLRATTATRAAVTLFRQNAASADSVPSSTTRQYVYADGWTSVSAKLSDDSSDISLQMDVRDSLAFATSWRRNGLFRPKTLQVNAISYNPNTRIVGLENLQVKAPVSRWSAGVFAGYGVQLGGNTGWTAGVGVQYRLLSW